MRPKTQPHSVAVVGPPGCGKTHNAERIRAHLGLAHITEGDQLSIKDWPAEGHLILSILVPKTFPYRLYEDVMQEIDRDEEAEQRKNEVRVESSHDTDDDDDDDFDRLAPPKPPKRVAAKPALAVQVGGTHYKGCAIQPVEFAEANELKFLEGCVVKRVTRHDKPTGKGRQDIEKAIHELQLLLELRYPEKG